MLSKPESQKIQRTRQKIQTTFLSLYKEKPIDQISIKELTLAAGINRGTFYLRYFSLVDLIDSIETTHLEALSAHMRNFPNLLFSTSDPGSLTQFFIPALQYIESNMDEFRILLSPHSRPNFRQALHQKMRANLSQRFDPLVSKTSGKDRLEKEYILEYIVSANLGVIIRWIQSDRELTAEDMTNLISNNSLRGPFKMMSGLPGM